MARKTVVRLLPEYTKHWWFEKIFTEKVTGTGHKIETAKCQKWQTGLVQPMTRTVRQA
tara:strand:+ start:229 stop:402 length:174 start_codon:yes stop_codon:yes gene_type:complete